MFNKKKQPPLKSLIAHGSQIVGNIVFADGMRVEGAVIGNIRANEGPASILVISESAHVVGEITADHIIVNGSVKGPIHARMMLELQPNARIEGNVKYAAMELHQGALITGQLEPILLSEEKPTLKLAANNQ
jgi:cytoskeletal protein CcmA (bactofilin family)